MTASTAPSPWRAAAPWFLASLALRLLVALSFAEQPVWPAWDEAGYAARATAMAQLVTAWTRGEPADPQLLADAYGRGAWPPLHPALMGLVLAVWPSWWAARLVPLVASALTTAVVYVLAWRLAAGPSHGSSSGPSAVGSSPPSTGPKAGGAARWAALVHLLHPSFVAFSHLAWSESVYLLALLLVCERLCAAAELGGRSRFLAWCAGGAALGAAGLTRASVLVLWVVVALAFARRMPVGARARAAATIGVTALVVALPWLVALARQEGRLVPLSTTGGYNLLIGQLPDDAASSRAEAKRAAAREARRLAADRGWSDDQAARFLALERMREDPLAAAGRAGTRLLNLLAPESHARRHLSGVVYPPLLPGLLPPLSLLIVTLSFATWGCVLVGLLAPGAPLAGRDRRLLLLLAAAAAAPHLLTVASSRLGLPLLALLLPAAGAGLAHLLSNRRGVGASCGILVVSALAAAGWPQPPGASAWYREVRPGGRLADRMVLLVDPKLCPHLLVAPGSVGTLLAAAGTTGSGSLDADGEAPADGAAAAGSSVAASAAPQEPIAATSGYLALTVETVGPEEPWVALSCGPATVRYAPIRRERWRRPVPTGLAGVTAVWLGAEGVRPTPCDANWPVRWPLRGLTLDSGSSATPPPACRPPAGVGSTTPTPPPASE
jgi:hypothetical protein